EQYARVFDRGVSVKVNLLVFDVVAHRILRIVLNGTVKRIFRKFEILNYRPECVGSSRNGIADSNERIGRHLTKKWGRESKNQQKCNMYLCIQAINSFTLHTNFEKSHSFLNARIRAQD